MALYVIHQDIITECEKLEQQCTSAAIKKVVTDIKAMLVLLQSNNTYSTVVYHRKSLINQGKKTAEGLNNAVTDDESIHDLIKLGQFFHNVAHKFGSGEKKYERTIFEQETITLLTKTVNLKEVALAFCDGIQDKVEAYQQEKSSDLSKKIQVPVSDPIATKSLLVTPVSDEKTPQATSVVSGQTSHQPDVTFVEPPEKMEYVRSKRSKKEVLTNSIKKETLKVFENLNKLIPFKPHTKKDTLILTQPHIEQEHASSSETDRLFVPVENEKSKNSVTLDVKHKNAPVLSDEPLKTPAPEVPQPLKTSSLNPDKPAMLSQNLQKQQDLKQRLNASKKDTQTPLVQDYSASNRTDKSPSFSTKPGFSNLELCMMIGIGCTVVGLLLVIPYVIYKTCGTASQVQEPEESTYKMGCAA